MQSIMKNVVGLLSFIVVMVEFCSMHPPVMACNYCPPALKPPAVPVVMTPPKTPAVPSTPMVPPTTPVIMTPPKTPAVPSTPMVPPTTPASPPAGQTCPLDALKLGVCADVLGGLLHISLGDPSVNKCCPVLQGLLELEAALCLCTTIKVNLLNLNIVLPLALELLAICGINPPPGFTCPTL